MFAQTPAPASNAALLHPASLKEQAPPTFKVKITTTKGDIVVQVTRSWAPKGADRFYNLVKNGFFTDAAFFRYVPGFIVQFGIPADPKVAAVWQSANITDDPVTQDNAPGTLVFATAGPNTRTTQLFINLADNTRGLGPQGFAPFGKVIQGMDIVSKLYSGYGESPNQGLIQSQGKAYLDKSFPKLDSIKSATIVP
jgi:peptidyl-prolyl cis-trans isomerase A (cyclophilin A)